MQRLTGVRVGRFEEHLARRGFLAVLIARLIPVVPFAVVNYLAGVTAIRVRVFVVATALGMLPATTAYVALGAYGSRPGSWPFVVAVAALVALTVIGGTARWQRRRAPAPASGPVSEIGVSATPSDDGSPSTPS